MLSAGEESFINNPILPNTMELKILEEKKNRFVFELAGESHTVCRALQKELWNDSHVKAAGYDVAHPLIDKPKIVVETDGADPKKAVVSALKRVEKDLQKFKELAKKIK